MKLDTGDHCRHIPSGEDWVVACVVGERVSWKGWPEGTAALKDCELIKKATEEERLAELKLWAQLATDDHRVRYAKQQLQDIKGPK